MSDPVEVRSAGLEEDADGGWGAGGDQVLPPLLTRGSGVAIAGTTRRMLTEEEGAVADLAAREVGEYPLGTLFGLVAPTPALDALVAARLGELRALEGGQREAMTRLLLDGWVGSWSDLLVVSGSLGSPEQ